MTQYFTKEGLQKLKEELHELKTKEMKRVVGLIAEAAAFGDLKENHAYHEAKNMQAFLMRRISELEAVVNEAIVSEKKDSDQIQIGSQVLISLDGSKERYHIVAPAESNILASKISYKSPLGEKLIGKKVNEEFDHEINGRKIKVKIIQLS